MNVNKKLLKMAIEIVDFPIKNGDFPWQNVSSPEGINVFCFFVLIGESSRKYHLWANIDVENPEQKPSLEMVII